MLDQLGRHGGFDLTVEATGDLHVDGHHTVEDVGILLGEAFREALGDKAGVRRFASGLFPLDEALVEVALDLSGRPFVVYDVPFGEVLPLGDPPFDPEMAEHFWQSFATAAGITLHVTPAARAATPTTSSRRRSRAWPAACATRCGSRAAACPSHQGRDRELTTLDRACSTTASATCARPRRRSSTSAPTPGSPPTPA